MLHIRFGQEVRSAEWDEDTQRWTIECSDETLTAQVLVAGTGPLHKPSIPDIPGLDHFEGRAYHSAQWDHGHDASGRNTTLWPGFTWPFRRLVRRFDAEHYELRAPARVPLPVAAPA